MLRTVHEKKEFLPDPLSPIDISTMYMQFLCDHSGVGMKHSKLLGICCAGEGRVSAYTLQYSELTLSSL